MNALLETDLINIKPLNPKHFIDDLEAVNDHSNLRIITKAKKLPNKCGNPVFKYNYIPGKLSVELPKIIAIKIYNCGHKFFLGAINAALLKHYRKPREV